MIFEQIADENHVPRRLGHLVTVEVNHADVNPEAYERPNPGHGLRLCNLRFMMRKDEIASAAMDVDLTAQVF